MIFIDLNNETFVEKLTLTIKCEPNVYIMNKKNHNLRQYNIIVYENIQLTSYKLPMIPKSFLNILKPPKLIYFRNLK